MKHTILLACTAMLLSVGNLLAQKDSTFVSSTIKVYPMNFDKSIEAIENYIDENSQFVESKVKNFESTKYHLTLTQSQYTELKNKLDEFRCKTYFSEEHSENMTKEITKLKTEINDHKAQIAKINAEIVELQSLAKSSDTNKTSQEEIEESIKINRSDIQSIKDDITNTERTINACHNKIGIVNLDLDIVREITTSKSSKVRFVNMPGFEYSYLLIDNPANGISADSYSGYMLKYLFTRGKSYLSVGVFKANDVAKTDTTTYTDIFNFSFGQDFYSRHLGRGSRHFLNLYSGYNIGFLNYTGETTSQKNLYISPSVGIELFKNNFLLWDVKASYFLPYEQNLNLRGWQFATSINVVF